LKPASVLGSPPEVKMVGMGMTYDGHLVIGAINAIAVIDREFERKPVVHYLPKGQIVSNSFSIDERNAIYVASGSDQARGDGMLHKIVWDGHRLSSGEADGGWVARYDG